MDALDPVTVRVLYNLVILGKQPGASQRKSSTHNIHGGGGGGQKKKPARRPGQASGRGGKSAHEAERVRLLEEELHRLEQTGETREYMQLTETLSDGDRGLIWMISVASEGSYDQDEGDGYSEEQYYDEEG